MVLSERTVASHVDHILAKLGVSSRTAVAAVVLRTRLA
jgi:DNA-binding NarL/FixJ family response regulator